MPAAPSPGLVEAWRDVMVSGWHEVKKGRRKTARQSRFCSEADYAEPSLDKAPSVDILPEPAPAAKCQNTDDVVDRFETPTRWLVDELCRSTAREAVSDLPPSCCASGSWQLVVERTFISVAPRSDGQRYTASAPGRLVGPHPPSCRPAARAKAVQGAVEPDLVDEAAELWPTAGAECSSSSEGLPDSEAGEAEDTDVEGANDHSEVDAGNEDGEQGNNDEAENLAEDSEPEATAPLAEEETEEHEDEEAKAVDTTLSCPASSNEAAQDAVPAHEAASRRAVNWEDSASSSRRCTSKRASSEPPVTNDTPSPETFKLEYITREELAQCFRQPNVQVIDVRNLDFFMGHIPGARHVPHMNFDKMLRPLAREFAHSGKTVVFHCMNSQHRGPSCAQRLQSYLDMFFYQPACQVKVLRGGFQNWQRGFARLPEAAQYISTSTEDTNSSLDLLHTSTSDSLPSMPPNSGAVTPASQSQSVKLTQTEDSLPEYPPAEDRHESQVIRKAPSCYVSTSSYAWSASPTQSQSSLPEM
eukprot:gnl/TRDRNA2_/TRDRNA2_169223_c1_seq8.p1 gnl/TRDRNA2_/TRDRNA2_169223_c1~~gnl/TRDRNA2_/TRDRNA2_169223_c1_seq8.p1  ORF type:complete len:529 (+),score=96.38 gnl/TRDRNA2_/TRDRNA2_169223_c1_seq8:109-1695(+)